MHSPSLRRARTATAALLCLVFLGSAAWPAVAQPSDDHTLIEVDFASIRLVDLAEFFSRVTGQNLIFVPDAVGERTVTVVSPRPIGRDEFEELLEAVLSLHGLTVERRVHYWLIREP